MSQSGIAGREQSMFGEITGLWWLFLVTGLIWLMISLIVLRFDATSVSTVGVLIGVLFLVAGLNEFMIATVVPSWKWAHILLGIIFIIAGIVCFAHPKNAFWALASIVGFLFVLYGTLEIIESAMARDVNNMWGLGLAAGIILVLLGFWASQQFYPARAALILIWVGFFALFRGISEIVLAFHMRRLHKGAEAAA